MSKDPTAIPIEFDPQKQRMVGVTYHGNMPFDVPYISEIAPNLWQGGCEEGLLLPLFIEHVVSLYPWEEYISAPPLTKSTLSVVMYDSEDQAYDQVDELAKWVNRRRYEGPVLVHCQAGLNRSSLVVARALMMDSDKSIDAKGTVVWRSGMTANAAIALIREKRSPACLCNPAFEKWLREQ